jgi:hypothetical protein
MDKKICNVFPKDIQKSRTMISSISSLCLFFYVIQIDMWNDGFKCIWHALLSYSPSEPGKLQWSCLHKHSWLKQFLIVNQPLERNHIADMNLARLYHIDSLRLRYQLHGRLCPVWSSMSSLYPQPRDSLPHLAKATD